MNYVFIGDGVKCFSCGREDGVECNSDHPGTEVHCQMDSPENENFGDACYVGHDGKIYLSLTRSNVIKLSLVMNKILIHYISSKNCIVTISLIFAIVCNRIIIFSCY